MTDPTRAAPPAPKAATAPLPTGPQLAGAIGAALAAPASRIAQALQDLHGRHAPGDPALASLEAAGEQVRQIARCSQQLARLAAGRLRQSHEKLALHSILHDVLLEHHAALADMYRRRIARLLQAAVRTEPPDLLPEDTAAALATGVVGVGLFRSEFLFMGRQGNLPDEEEQYQAYRRAVEGMNGLPVTIRTIDVGADKPLDDTRHDSAHLNPALGLRAIRWSLADPSMFLTQLRAILRAAAHGKVNLLIPMLTHASEIRQTLQLIEQARQELDRKAMVHGPVRLGAMIEIPAAALSLRLFLKHFDFLSIGTNDLIQYTLAIDRADESVAHLYDPLHPAVLRLVADTIAACRAQGKGVSVCGEMAGDVTMTKLLLGLGLRSFSMHPSQVLAVKQRILLSHADKLKPWAEQVLESDDPATLMPR